MTMVGMLPISDEQIRALDPGLFVHAMTCGGYAVVDAWSGFGRTVLVHSDGRGGQLRIPTDTDRPDWLPQMREAVEQARRIVSNGDMMRDALAVMGIDATQVFLSRMVFPDKPAES